jgi:hypothetical protein
LRTLLLAATALSVALAVLALASNSHAQPKQCASVTPKSFPCGQGQAQACKKAVPCQEGGKKSSRCVEWTCVGRKGSSQYD